MLFWWITLIYHRQSAKNKLFNKSVKNNQTIANKTFATNDGAWRCVRLVNCVESIQYTSVQYLAYVSKGVNDNLSTRALMITNKLEYTGSQTYGQKLPRMEAEQGLKVRLSNDIPWYIFESILQCTRKHTH